MPQAPQLLAQGPVIQACAGRVSLCPEEFKEINMTKTNIPLLNEDFILPSLVDTSSLIVVMLRQFPTLIFRYDTKIL